MEHYSLEKWADFARQVIGEQERAEMQSHLDDDGCRKCAKALGLWQHVHVAARRELSYQPPESAVRSMKGTFAIQGPRKATLGARSIAALLFDSAVSPLTVGVRSAAATSRQLLYGAGNYRIDVRIEVQADSQKIAVVGQVLNSADPDEIVGAVPVTLARGRKVLAEAVTSPFGEFDVECDRKGPFELRVMLPSEVLTLPLIGPTSGALDDVPEAANSKGLTRNSNKRTSRTRKKV
jgi:hypothetical protein